MSSKKADRHAWDGVVQAFSPATSGRLAGTGKEARRRISGAAGALAGRPATTRWGPLLSAGAIGAAVGAAGVIAAARFLLRARQGRTGEELVVDTRDVLSPAERDRLMRASSFD